MSSPMPNMPLVSVGIPTYNRARFLERMLLCVTQQTYKNLDIMISDNCSPNSDTEELVCRFMANDSRIRYVRQARNIGPVANFQFVLDQAIGDYFVWAADDDAWRETYVEKCMTELLNNPKMVLCYSEPIIEIYRGQADYHLNVDMVTVGLTKRQAMRKVLLNQRLNTEFYGVMKTEAARRYTLKNRFGDDHIFMLHMAIEGTIGKTDPWLFIGKGGTSSAGMESLIRTLALSRWHWYFAYLIQAKNIAEFILSSNKLSLADKVSGLYSVIKRCTDSPYRWEVRVGLHRLRVRLVERVKPVFRGGLKS